MIARPLAWLVYASIAATAGVAAAQSPPPEQTIRFSLKPRHGLAPRILPVLMEPRLSARLDPITQVSADDRGSTMQIGMQRMTRRIAASGVMTPLVLDTLPRSRMRRYWIEQQLRLGDDATASLGWHGVTLSNRNANVTVGAGKGRLRARDWFLPRGALTVRPDPALSVTLDYAETLLAYGDSGAAGPMGLTDATFRSLRYSLKPQTQNRAQLRADWAASSAITLSVSMHGGRLDDRLGFDGRGVLPVNRGSAAILGTLWQGSGAITPQLRWHLRYSDARVQVAGNGRTRERSLAAETRWEEGPWRASVSLARTSPAALAVIPHRDWRIGARIDYVADDAGGRPLRLSVQLTDPNGLASNSFALDDVSGSLHAVDQHRALMASAQFAL